MKVRNGLLVAALVAAGAMSLTAVAGGGHGGHRGGGHGKMLMEKADTDGNGALSKVELDAFNLARAQELDLNKDGSVTAEEMKAYREQQRAKRAAERMARLDGNKDGKVSVQELADSRGQWIAKLDADGNGELTAEEMRAGRHGRRGGHHGHGGHGGAGD